MCEKRFTCLDYFVNAPKDCQILDKKAWKVANPALGKFRSLQDIKDFAQQADRLPAKANSFRWLFLNQRIEAQSPFLSRAEWEANDVPPEVEASDRISLVSTSQQAHSEHALL